MKKYYDVPEMEQVVEIDYEYGKPISLEAVQKALGGEAREVSKGDYIKRRAFYREKHRVNLKMKIER